jgi:hypothetical protein
MKHGLDDITLYTVTSHHVGTPEFNEEMALMNYVCDLYLQKMNGYKPPGVRRITIQPHYHGIWLHASKSGSIARVAPYFDYDEFVGLEKKKKYGYLLEVIHNGTTEASKQFGWDTTIFEKAYADVLGSNFVFKVEYPSKTSRNGKRSGKFIIQKTEEVTSAFVSIESDASSITRKLFDKKNAWCYDLVYALARHTKWFDADRFGIAAPKKIIECWYSIKGDRVALFEQGEEVKQIDFSQFFLQS